MARNRLMLFIVLLVGLAVVAAAVAPRDRDPSGTGATATTPPPSTTPRGPEIATIVRHLPERDGRAAIVRARVGDLVKLVVTTEEPDQVIIGDNDRVESAEPGTPARFEFFVEQPGTLPVRLGNSGRLVGRIEVQERSTVSEARTRTA